VCHADMNTPEPPPPVAAADVDLVTNGPRTALVSTTTTADSLTTQLKALPTLVLLLARTGAILPLPRMLAMPDLVSNSRTMAHANSATLVNSLTEASSPPAARPPAAPVPVTTPAISSVTTVNARSETTVVLPINFQCKSVLNLVRCM